MTDKKQLVSILHPPKDYCHVLLLRHENEVFGAPNINVDGKIVFLGKDGKKYIKYV